MKFLRRTPLLLVVSVLLLLGAGFVYVHIYGVIVRKNVEIGTGVRQLSGTSASEEQLADLKKIVAENAKKWEKVSSYVIEANGVVSFVQKIETLGRTLGVDVEISSLTEESPKSEGILPDLLELLTVQLVASGDWKDMLQLLVFIESMPIATRVNDVQLKRVGEEFTKTGSWSGFFSLVALKKK
ncbi:MAG: Uncharacterized protein G01um101448_505 [Parcubacteria group bacterium Gr01-1014_48]|nr:MAG: Uncharacterized protein Greene041614_824 [Parcubacteria group bacterium Greene0416_14]TSC73862.1 MAG: Uncharacterized protein G01um101448_505 [Parcubacteria group bacterium Gr01-1014_48]TSD00415.1 MAG: Uncharacterized protein Greene101415_873 [Parcubacteria group bacterium Greene1014_15]TSD07520.1 MAG: Uncharacterized protein Greene07144_862 [Parcubacteria group bacterium Greene0714_4]